MTSNPVGFKITERDLNLLAALDYGPLTAGEAYKLSQTWPVPFGKVRLVRERLLVLSAAKVVTTHAYAITRWDESPNYYLLTKTGYQLVHGHESIPPTAGFFSPVALARQPHQRAISRFIVHSVCGAHRCGKQFTDFYRENTVQLAVADDTVFPDASFVLQQDGEPFRYFLEMDTGSESIVSQKKSADSIERKIRIYEAYQEAHPETRFRVLFVFANNSIQRLGHVLDAARRIARDPNRTVFYCITLKEYLTNKFPVTSPIFIDHRHGRQSLLPDIGLARLRSGAFSVRPGFNPTLLGVKRA